VGWHPAAGKGTDRRARLDRAESLARRPTGRAGMRHRLALGLIAALAARRVWRTRRRCPSAGAGCPFGYHPAERGTGVLPRHPAARSPSQPHQAAYARWRQAEALLITNKASKLTASVLRQAHQAASRLDARPLQHEIERLARRACIDLQTPSPKPSPAEASPPAAQLGLTPREQEVLQHLVGGRTNRQIARALFISEKTASVHVFNIMSKLGAANRSEAAAIAHRLRLV
jgi:DNA-binding CsgD family transcriptional regulator